jgi:hypothetical protein
MRDLKELGSMALGFIPWILFLFFSGTTLTSLERAIILSLFASLAFGFRKLRRGYILAWGTLLFFCFCVVLVNFYRVIWVAKHMDLLAHTTLAGIMWLTILVGKPFALQYARSDVPKERWNDPKFIQGCRFISLVWAWLMSLQAGLSVLRLNSMINLPAWVYPDARLIIMLMGVMITILFKRHKRLQHERVVAKN